MILSSVNWLCTLCCLVTHSMTVWHDPLSLSDAAARMAAIRSVNHAQGVPVDSKLYVHRLEELESEYLGFLGAGASISGTEGFYFFEVSEAGCNPEIGPKGERECTIVCDANPRWYVAVSKATGSSFRLSGFEDSTEEFNRLAVQSRVRLSDAHSATRYVEFFLTLLEGPGDDFSGRKQILVTGKLALKQLVERNFYLVYREPRSESEFTSWWRRFMAVRPVPALRPRTTAGQTPFEVIVFVLLPMREYPPHLALDKYPELQELTLNVTADGSIRTKARRRLFPR